MAQRGEIIDGKYEILREVGRGGMSIVYLAMDKRLNKQWAIKEFRKDKDDASKQVALKALLDEANLMKKLDHPTLPRIVDIIDNKQTVYVIMDYIEGESLNKVLDAYGAQPQEAVIEWAKQLSEVLDYLHTQNPPVIYRDMKPANIMLKPDGTVRLIDFGIAREYKEGKDGDTEAIGTRGYAAPEQFGGRGQTDARTDIYSLGVTLYHLVTGKNPAEPPYEIYPIRHWDPSFSSGFEWLIQKCTQLNPGDRYQSCAEVSYVLDNLDKFDTEYKKKKKTKLTLFLVSLIATLVFAAASVALFLTSSSVKQNSYDNLIKNQHFIEAIDVDKDNPEAYVKLAEQLYSDNITVKAGSASGSSEVQSEVTLGDLMAWFPSDVMDDFKEEYPHDYSDIQFKLGYVIWEKYDSGSDTENMKKAMPYFEKVLKVAYDASDKSKTSYETEADISAKIEKALEATGLSAKQYNLAEVFFRASYFQNKKGILKENAAGDKMKLEAFDAFVGIDVNSFEESPYLAFWKTNDQLVESIKNNSEISEIVKLKTISKLVYILSEHSGEFSKYVTKSEYVAFIESIEDVLDNIPDTVDNKDQKNKIENDFENKVLVAIDAYFKNDKGGDE